MGSDDADWFNSVLPEPEILDEILGDDPTAALVGAARTRAPVEMGVDRPPNIDEDPAVRAQFELAAAAAKKLRLAPKPELSPEETAALHALVHLVSRPALRVRRGDVPAVPESWPSLQAALPVVRARLKGVGRLDKSDGTQVGTGWFIAPDLLVTNNHVVAGLCGLDPHGDSKWRDKLESATVAHNALWASDETTRPTWKPDEAPDGAEAAGRISEVVMTHPNVDMAFVAIGGVPESEQSVLPLAEAPFSDELKLDYYLAGYPALLRNQIDRFHPALVNLLFGGPNEGMDKRVSPGAVTEVDTAVDRPRAGHDATTLGGSSGSAVIDLTTHQVVGLHYSGHYGVVNNAVALWKMQDDPAFAQFGITFG